MTHIEFGFYQNKLGKRATYIGRDGHPDDETGVRYYLLDGKLYQNIWDDYSLIEPSKAVTELTETNRRMEPYTKMEGSTGEHYAIGQSKREQAISIITRQFNLS